MIRRIVPVLALMTLGLAWCVQADEPAKPKADAKPSGDLSLEQEILARQYRDFEKALFALAKRLKTSPKPEDRERAANLEKAIALSADKDVKGQFDKLITILKTSKTLSLQEITVAMNDSKMVADDIKTIIALLLADNRDDELKREKKRLQDLIKALEEVIRKQKIVRAQTEAGKSEKEPLVDSQKKVTKNTADIAKAMGDKDGKGKETKEAKNSEAKGKAKVRARASNRATKRTTPISLPTPETTSLRSRVFPAVSKFRTPTSIRRKPRRD